MPDVRHHEEPVWTLRFAGGIVLMSTAIVAYLSEVFVSPIEVRRESSAIEMSDMFIGVINELDGRRHVPGHLLLFRSGVQVPSFGFPLSIAGAAQIEGG
jgi:hypothetical protein